jgi:hypothetical protein
MTTEDEKMPHWKSLMDREYLGHWDLPEGKDVVVIIESVNGGTVSNGSKSQKKPIVRFKGKAKAAIFNATNCKTVERLYGPNTDEWVGKPIALYVASTNDPSNPGVQVPCIRVRPKAPQKRTEPATSSEPAEREPGSEG